ncbi:MAG: peptidylprolyl isomerase [Candidatus Micrarchaeota archaeon]|nr:peptidylprolyl isomerase [Candidatus Micrarchaeota archaeon]
MVKVKKGDLVRIDYTGRLASNGMVFETTDRQLALEAGIYEEGKEYKPKLTVFGQNVIMRGMEDAIVASTLGKSEEFMISPEKAFGLRQPALVRLLPEKEFIKQNIKPVPGMLVTLDGIAARVKSVTSGRVVVDFNHPLAGESVIYTLKVHEVISEPEKKAKAILEELGISAEVELKEGRLCVVFPPGLPQQKVEAAKKAILACAPETEFKSS